MFRNLAIEEGGDLTPRLGPWDRFYFAGIQFLDALRNFVPPCLFDRSIHGVVKAFQKRSCQSGTGFLRKGQGFL